MQRSFQLSGLDGSNPLGYLAALGTLVTLYRHGEREPKLKWTLASRWIPVLHDLDCRDNAQVSRAVADALRGKPVQPDAEKRLGEAQKKMEAAQKAIKKKRDEIKQQGLRGTERLEAIERELRPLEGEYEQRRREWLGALREAVPWPELALGKRIDCTREEYRERAASFLGSAGLLDRSAPDFLAAFGSDGSTEEDNVIQSTPFCFITGSGHQFFLDTVRRLVSHVTLDNVRRVLFQPWDYGDEGLSMRWDPIEDRRYALLDRDPSDESARTMWVANLLAYRALVLFPTAPVGGRLATAGWTQESFTWPLWEHPVGVDVVRSLVQLRELAQPRPDATALRAKGIVAVYRAQRISVGKGANRKLNFTPARRVA